MRGIPILEQKPELRIDSSQTENTISVPRVRWSRLGLCGAASVVGVCWVGALAARRVLPRPAARLAGSAARGASLPSRASAAPSALRPRDPTADARARLEQFEAQRRRATDFAHLPPANLSHGADPYALVALDAGHALGVLRGASAVVLLDAQLRELQRVPLPNSSVTVARARSGDCWVAGETSHSLTRFQFDGRRLRPRESLEIPGILGLRALASGPEGLLYALDVHDGRLLTIDPTRPAAPVLDSRLIGHGPLSVRRVGASLIVDALLDHALIVLGVDKLGRVLEERARIQHDGPIWGFDAAELPDGALLLVASGVEDHRSTARTARSGTSIHSRSLTCCPERARRASCGRRTCRSWAS